MVSNINKKILKDWDKDLDYEFIASKYRVSEKKVLDVVQTRKDYPKSYKDKLLI